MSAAGEPLASRRGFFHAAAGAGAGALGAGAGVFGAGCATPATTARAGGPRGDRSDVKLGINLLLWTTHVTAEHYPLLARLRETGFDGVEVPIGGGDAVQFRAIAAELDRIGLQRTAVTSVDASTNPISPDAAVRRAAVERLRWAIEMAHELGAEVLCGPFHSAYKEFVGRGPTDEEYLWCAEAMRAVADEAQQAGILLGLEALNRFECYLINTAAQSRRLVAMIDHPSVRYHYDTHHAHIEELDVRAAIRDSAGMIGHVHVSENDRGVPGRGQVAWARTFEALQAIGYRGWLTIESFSRLDAGFAGVIHIWRDFFDDPFEVASEGRRFMDAAWRDSRGAARG